MHVFIRRFLRFFDSYTIRYEGAGISNNEFYAGKHWTVRAGIKKKYAKIFGWLIKGKAKKYDTIGIVLFYNSKHDADNVTGGMIKVFLDTIKGKYIKDDAPQYCKMVASIFDPDLPKNTFEFVVIKI